MGEVEAPEAAERDETGGAAEEAAEPTRFAGIGGGAPFGGGID